MTNPTTTKPALRNNTTGEVAPAHKLGTDADGRALYAWADGWTPTVPYEQDEDGNWIAQPVV